MDLKEPEASTTEYTFDFLDIFPSTALLIKPIKIIWADPSAGPATTAVAATIYGGV